MSDTQENTQSDQGVAQIAAKAKAAQQKGGAGYHIKYTDIHTPENEENERQSGISDIYLILTIFAGGYTYLYRNKMMAWLCVYLFYCNIIN
jgi:hypothetical protein